MKLKIQIPTRVLVEQEVTKVTAEAPNGSFCLLPKHVDFVAALEPGLFSYELAGGREEVLALDEGVLVKCGEDVLVSARNAVEGESLDQLERSVSDVFEQLDERQKKTRSALARLEADFVNQYMRMKEHE